LQIDPATAAAARLEVSIPVGSVLTTTPALDDMLKSDQWFDAAKYPNATFVSTKVTPTAPDSATITGKFTLHGVTKQVTLKARLIGSGTNPMDKTYNVDFDAIGKIRRSDFGIKQYLPLVGDEVTPEDRRRVRSSAVALCGRTIPPAGTPGSPSSFIG
jgi:polyisoprenoid-binding protein YceI